MEHVTSYEEAVAFLFGQLPMYQRSGKTAFKKTLDNIITLCDCLGNPQDRLPCIHIAGTNGKGSVCHLVAAGLQANGYRVGVYTSPHYRDYRERIKINGDLIPEEDVIDFVRTIQDLASEVQPSFFEITVAMAFYYFDKKRVDIAIIETGLGGRLDSTNIITPLLSVITNISMDHMDMLGDTLPKIAAEKAGIIKPGIPVIIGETQDEDVQAVFAAKAEEGKSILFYADQTIALLPSDNIKVDASVDDQSFLTGIDLDPSHPYQQRNLKTAIAVLYHIKDHYPMHAVMITDGLNRVHELTYYLGRWMRLGDRPTIIADSAHNEAGITSVTKQVSDLSYDRLHIVYGTVADKDLSTILPLMPTEATYYYCKADIPRGLDAHRLAAQGSEYDLIGEAYTSVSAAYTAAIDAAQADDLVLVLGSIFVIAEIL